MLRCEMFIKLYGYVNHNDTTHVLDRYIVQLTKKKELLHVQSSMIHKLYYLGLCLFILLDHAFSIRTSFSRTNTFEIHSISTSKYLIHLITDDIKNYCIFGTIVPLLNVKPNWEKVIYLSFNSFIQPVSCMQHSLINLIKLSKFIFIEVQVHK